MVKSVISAKVSGYISEIGLNGITTQGKGETSSELLRLFFRQERPLDLSDGSTLPQGHYSIHATSLAPNKEVVAYKQNIFRRLSWDGLQMNRKGFVWMMMGNNCSCSLSRLSTIW